MFAATGVALVTGGAKRVGRAIALDLARAGCDVAVHCRNSRDEARDVAAEIKSMGCRSAVIEADLADPAGWKLVIDRTVDALGGLRVLVNNASAFLVDGDDSLTDFTVDSWERMLRVNLLAPMGLCHHAADHLRAGSDGVIVNLLDASLSQPWRRHLSYTASKAGLAAMTQALAKALAPEVRVVGVAPGIAVFPDAYDESTRQKLVSKVPLERAGSPEQVAAVVTALVAIGGYITGEIVRVDGGRHLQ